MRDWKRPQHERVDERENRDIRADAECEGGDDRQREGRAAPERSNRLAQIARHGLEALGSAHILSSVRGAGSKVHVALLIAPVHQGGDS